MKTCVTGGAGFIGSNLVERLVTDGHEVVVLDDLSTGRLENLSPWRKAITFIQGDLRDPAAVSAATEGCEVVFHQAALASVARSVADPEQVTAVNVGGTLNVLLAARDAGVRRVVFASSSSVYGDTPVLPKIESMPIRAMSPYAASKAAGEAYLSAFASVYDIETVALRYFNVYGPRQAPDSQYAAVVPLFIDAMLAGKSPTIHGDGDQTRDFTYVGDVVEVLMRAATTPQPPAGPCNVGGGKERISINRLAELIAESTGYDGEIEHTTARVGDVRDSLADTQRLTDWLDWAPCLTLAEGIERTVAAHRAAKDQVRSA